MRGYFHEEATLCSQVRVQLGGCMAALLPPGALSSLAGSGLAEVAAFCPALGASLGLGLAAVKGQHGTTVKTVAEGSTVCSVGKQMPQLWVLG